jgi:hypothetical protein
MKSKTELTEKIVNITKTIKEEVPGVSEYLDEMPAKLTDEKDPEATVRNLLAYYDSLQLIVDKYLIDCSREASISHNLKRNSE